MKHQVALVIVLFLLPVISSAATVTYIYTDYQGTPLAEAAPSGDITAIFDYQPYGSQTLGTPANGPGYTGHVGDLSTGLIYMQARYDDPGVHFISVDPVKPKAGNIFTFNRYVYANNNPYSNFDPSGRTCKMATSGGGYDCRVDENSGGLSDEQIDLINQAYTKAVNRLLAHPGRQSTILVKGISFVAKSGDIAKALIGVAVDTGRNTQNRATTLGTLVKEDGYVGKSSIVIHAISTAYDRDGAQDNIGVDLAKTFIHEGVHLIPQERSLYEMWKQDMAAFRFTHKDPYNDASSWLFDEAPKTSDEDYP
ncbi:RHS repeat domain-containing protein [Dyella sp. 20L07]|uniref:RHS repeat domain-containing protein n=1 Tax=Dyella sp. 20L07 TaxID=3384240 RepID=UPI003D2AD823